MKKNAKVATHMHADAKLGRVIFVYRFQETLALVQKEGTGTRKDGQYVVRVSDLTPVPVPCVCGREHTAI